jgi:HAD superfamily hydrolase (TIGR01458 family)
VITNTTARSRRAIADGLRGRGFEIADEEVFTAAVAAADYLRQERPGARVFLLGDAQAEDLAGVHLVGVDDQPEIILISGADDSFNFESLNRAYRALLGGAELVAMHRNLSWMTRAGENLDSGAYLLGLERATGRAAVVTGKPAAEIFAAAAGSMGLAAGRVAMVGDDLHNDALAAQAAGMAGVLVRTGKFREEILTAAPAAPDRVIDSVASLPALCGLRA